MATNAQHGGHELMADDLSVLLVRLTHCLPVSALHVHFLKAQNYAD